METQSLIVFFIFLFHFVIITLNLNVASIDLLNKSINIDLDYNDPFFLTIIDLF